MDNNMQDQLIYVDIFDNPVGYGSKQEAHAKGILHRAFSVFIYFEDKLLLQQRAEGKYHSGGLWANTCCSHPRKGEDTLAAAHRRLQEEAGIACPDLKELGTFVYQHKFPNGLAEFEYDHILIGAYEGPYAIDPNEIKAMAWVDKSELAKDLKNNPEKYSVWFITAAPIVLSYLSK